jgi:amino acid permease
MLIVIFSYGGVSAVAMASSEVKDPKKGYPQGFHYDDVRNHFSLFGFFSFNRLSLSMGFGSTPANLLL